MSRWEENIRKVIPYTPGEQPISRIWSSWIPTRIRIRRHLEWRRRWGRWIQILWDFYPDPTAGELVHAIAKNYGLKDEQVFVGVGSDDVLAMSFLTFFNSQKPVLFSGYHIFFLWCMGRFVPYSIWETGTGWELSYKEGRLFQRKRRNCIPESECADRCGDAAGGSGGYYPP